jgi:hypothetical protein
MSRRCCARPTHRGPDSPASACPSSERVSRFSPYFRTNGNRRSLQTRSSATPRRGTCYSKSGRGKPIFSGSAG